MTILCSEVEMNKTAKKVTITISVIAVFVLICVLLSMRPVPNFEEKYAGTDLTVEIAGMERTGSYNGYLEAHRDAANAATAAAAAARAGAAAAGDRPHGRQPRGSIRRTDTF